MPPNQAARLAYIDWLRGFACLTMFEIHGYDAWLGGPARQSAVAGWSRFSGTVAAPLFIFLTGVSCALLADRMGRKGATSMQIGKRTMRRGAQIFAFALLFRLQEYIFGLPGALRTDLLRVDVLNLIGVAIIFLGVLCCLAPSRVRAIAAGSVAVAIAMLSPLLWTAWRPAWLPWYLESYVNGVHNLGVPQPRLFPIFPWAAFAFAGLAVGAVLFNATGEQSPRKTAAVFGVGGAALVALSFLLDHSPIRLYAATAYDYWHTSPNFFMARVGVVLLLSFVAFLWWQVGAGQKVFSPLIQLGQTSLLVYWVHIELAYGRFSILKKGAQSVPMATFGVLAIFVLMVGLSLARTRTKGKTLESFRNLFASRAASQQPSEVENA